MFIFLFKRSYVFLPSSIDYCFSNEIEPQVFGHCAHINSIVCRKLQTLMQAQKGAVLLTGGLFTRQSIGICPLTTPNAQTRRD